MSRTRRLLMIVAVLCLLAAACGDGESDGDTATDGAVEGSETAEEAATDADTTSDNGDGDGDDGDDAAEDEAAADDEVGEVTVVDAVGEVTLTATDAGVYVLDESAAVGLLTLEVEPLAVERFFQDVAVAPVLELTGVNTVDPGSVEAIAAAEPSLIVGVGHPTFLEARPQHEGVAPVVTPDFTTSWSDQLEVFATATGTTDRAGAVTAAVQARIDTLRADLAAAGFDGGEASIIQTFGSDYYSYGPTTLAGDLLQQLGFTRSEIQTDTDQFGFVQISPELLAQETDADVVFAVAGSDSGGVSVLDHPTVDVGDTPAGVVLEVWFQNHALAAWIILDDIEAILLGDGRTTSLDDVADVWTDLLTAVDAS
ncbi:MAG: ABC transporter substrate-binding protein [Actinomycetota bacterium]